MSEFDDFDRIFEKMITMTRRLPKTDLVAGSQQPSAPPEEPERDEMLEGKDSTTYIVDVSGRSEEDLNVSVAEDEIAVRSPDFAVKKRFPCQSGCVEHHHKLQQRHTKRASEKAEMKESGPGLKRPITRPPDRNPLPFTPRPSPQGDLSRGSGRW